MSSCVHFTKRRAAVLRKCELLNRRIVFPISKQNNRIKASMAMCRCCSSRLNPLMACCLDCATFGCLEHLRTHLQSKGHLFALSTFFGEIFCLKCNDFIYDRRAEKIRGECLNARRKDLGLSLQYRWNPGRTEVQLCRRSSLRLLQLVNSNNDHDNVQSSGANSLFSSARGLRGLINLGNTCFMNCIIQTLVHIPMLRDYFLSDQHHCRLGLANSKAELNTCLMCELSHIFQEFYSRDAQSPYVPHRLLHLVWTHAKHLSGYEQHDAHEFLISALNILHRHSDSISMIKNPHECKCIIDRLFTGQLQSDLTCTKCGRISTKLDPYWDISLELLNGKIVSSKVVAPPSTTSPSRLQQQLQQPDQQQQSSSSSSICNIGSLFDDQSNESNDSTLSTTTVRMASLLNPAASTSTATTATEECMIGTNRERSLEECLQNFVRAENLGTKIKCDNCGTYEVSTKQLTLRKLPIVACFHLKRFEHVNASNKRQKIKKPVRFPEFIDLTPYTTTYRNTEAITDATAAVGTESHGGSLSKIRLSQLSNRYSLFAVVNHTGSTESGHYTCYVRHQRDNWFNCNDQKISKERLEDVLASEGYLLFYCKSYIDYD